MTISLCRSGDEESVDVCWDRASLLAGSYGRRLAKATRIQTTIDVAAHLGERFDRPGVE